MYLDKIVETKVKEVAELAKTFDLANAERKIADMSNTRGFERALSNSRNRDMGLIAEVKKASPSKGLIRPHFDPVEIALAYEKAGADCLSVLTDVDYFQGSSEYLQAVHAAVKLPLLRKDFIIDERQIYEARLLGADAVLLIVSILKKEQLSSYIEIASSIGLDTLIEVHSEKELQTVLNLGSASLIGINNRNLQTFETSLETTAKLIQMIPEGLTIISESGIAGTSDMDFLKQAGAHGVLVGEYFMRQNDVGVAVQDLMGPLGESKGRL
ncbi:indole-3-glycerol phosphate synthase TrpC [Paenibacillus crassostreae]|uniref:Indole-3-glycerol phosphate synthase n=1 Tax=Paenibacillus crassostreae TaxID=1763538 RepID=A0A167DK69_9BACL|nr:indole-3-glycerol phosphate synthase TrpC [Paenibacillus crassostreae]AOZ91362.1 indole-3-glycerol phosphate synthase [Paenibacillus crassostreae]OAB74479.1 indole-3-glycerol phosphate synthase [Paenibacillus crassostreae]